MGPDVEVKKILQGYARWYFYGWMAVDVIGDWMLVDLDEVRTSGMIEDAIEAKQIKVNEDKCTSFVYIPHRELHAINAIVACDFFYTPSRAEIMKDQIPAAVDRVRARGKTPDMLEVGRELGGIVNPKRDRDFPRLWEDYRRRQDALK
jgi:hypothetical protein